MIQGRVLTIVGGTYREICRSPDWDQLFGSGSRAAAASSALVNQAGGTVRLVTAVASTESDELSLRALTYGYAVEVIQRKQEIQYQYEHPLAPPVCTHVPRAEVEIDLDETVDNLLIFGMVECGAPTIRARRVVYDPQAGRLAGSIGDLHLSADEICIVCNRVEAVTLLGVDNALPAADAARALVESGVFYAAVVKDGVNGAHVATPDSTVAIPCFATDEVFPIGSGDVFSGIFAAAWMILGESPQRAAEMASRAVAFSVQTRILPIPVDFEVQTNKFPEITPPSRVLSVYLAAPLFNMAEQWCVREVAKGLKSVGLNVFSPLDDVGLRGDATEIANADLEGLIASDVVLGLVDGADIGTVFELGYATSRNIPVVVFCERTPSAELTMLEGTGASIVRDFTTAIYKTAWKARQ